LNKILEPMSVGKPVFTTPKGIFGLDEAKNNFNILIFKEKDLVENLNRTIFDSQLLISVGNNAYQTIKNYHDEKSNKNKFIKYLNELIT